MKKDLITASLALSVLSVVIAGCAYEVPPRSPWSFETSEINKKEPAPLPQKRAIENEEEFKTLTSKMDEYQELLAVCDSLEQTEENREKLESCSRRLKALRQELIELTKPQEEQQE